MKLASEPDEAAASRTFIHASLLLSSRQHFPLEDQLSFTSDALALVVYVLMHLDPARLPTAELRKAAHWLHNNLTTPKDYPHPIDSVVSDSQQLGIVVEYVELLATYYISRAESVGA